jgi:hypothetical protein
VAKTPLLTTGCVIEWMESGVPNASRKPSAVKKLMEKTAQRKCSNQVTNEHHPMGLERVSSRLPLVV